MKNLFILLIIFIGLSSLNLTLKPVVLSGKFILNPNKVTPLSAEYHLDSFISNPITVHIKGKTQDMDIIHRSTYTNKIIPIHGLYPNHTNIVILSAGKISLTNQIITKKVKYKSANVRIDQLKKSDPKNQDIYFVNQSELGEPANDRHDIVGYDRKGDVRYIAEVQKLHYVTASNNQILIRNNDGVIDLLGNKMVSYKAKNPRLDIHHDSLQIGDHHIFLANSTWGIEDRVLEVDSKGNIIRDLLFGSLFRDIITNKKEISIMNKFIFDKENIFYKNGENIGIDWAHANSLVYDEKKDIMYFSLRHQGILAVDYSEWKLIWWLTDDSLNTKHEGVPNRGINLLDLPSLKPYRVAGDGITNGPKNQHALFLFKNGNLGMFDNVGDDTKNKIGSRYIEYKITKKNKQWTARKIREIRDPKLYSRITSDVDLLANKNLLIGWGEPSVLREYNSKNEVVFDMLAHHNWYLYRVDKMPLYPYTNKFKKYSLDANQVTKY